MQALSQVTGPRRSSPPLLLMCRIHVRHLETPTVQAVSGYVIGDVRHVDDVKRSKVGALIVKVIKRMHFLRAHAWARGLVFLSPNTHKNGWSCFEGYYK